MKRRLLFALLTPVGLLLLVGGAAAEDRLMAGVRARSALMARIDRIASNVLEIEQGLRQRRAAELTKSNQVTNVVLVALLSVTALLLAFLFRKYVGDVGKTYGAALQRERLARLHLETQEWVVAGQMHVAEAVQGDLSLAVLGERTLRALASYVGAEIGDVPPSFFRFVPERGNMRPGCFCSSPRESKG